MIYRGSVGIGLGEKLRKEMIRVTPLIQGAGDT